MIHLCVSIKRLRCTLMTAVLLFFCTSLSLGETFRYVADNRHGQAVPPYSWYNHCTNTHQGLHTQLFLHFADKLGLKAELVEAELARGTEGILEQAWVPLTEGRADFAMSLPALVKLNDKMIFSKERVLEFHPVLLLRAGQAEVSEFRDLEAMQGLSIKAGGTISYIEHKGYKLTHTIFDTLEEVKFALAAGKGDYWITDKYLANSLIDALKLDGKIKFSTFDLGLSEDIHIMARKNDQNIQIMNEIDQMLKSYKQTGLVEYMMHSVMKVWIADRQCVKE